MKAKLVIVYIWTFLASLAKDIWHLIPRALRKAYYASSKCAKRIDRKDGRNNRRHVGHGNIDINFCGRESPYPKKHRRGRRGGRKHRRSHGPETLYPAR